MVDLCTSMGEYHDPLYDIHTNNREKKGGRTSPLPRNELYDQLKGFYGSRTVYGNILVIKSDPSGNALNVLERELFFIERLVYRLVIPPVPHEKAIDNDPPHSYMEDDNRYDEFPVLINPLLLPVRENQEGWDSW